MIRVEAEIIRLLAGNDIPAQQIHRDDVPVMTPVPPRNTAADLRQKLQGVVEEGNTASLARNSVRVGTDEHLPSSSPQWHYPWKHVCKTLLPFCLGPFIRRPCIG